MEARQAEWISASAIRPSRVFERIRGKTAQGQVRDYVGLIGEEPLKDLEAALPRIRSRENRNVRIRPKPESFFYGRGYPRPRRLHPRRSHYRKRQVASAGGGKTLRKERIFFPEKGKAQRSGKSAPVFSAVR
jgi:hypothetical protein